MRNTYTSAISLLILGFVSGVALADSDCQNTAAEVKTSVEANPSVVLEIVENTITEHPGCACEIVKAAIEASKADAGQVAAIVETATTAAPEQLRLISQCALAVAPDALNEVQKVMARLEPAQGEDAYSGKSSKSPKAPIEVKPAWNPLDFPGEGIGPTPGGPGGYPFLPPTTVPPFLVPPVIIPPVIIPPVGTPTGFSERFPD